MNPLPARASVGTSIRHSLVVAFLMLAAAAVSAQERKPVTPEEVKHGRRADRFIAKPLGGFKGDRDAKVAGLRAATGARVLKRYADIGGLEINAIPAGADLTKMMADFRASGLYEYVEPDSIITLDATPDDPNYLDGKLWGLHNTGQDGGTNDADIDAPEAWDVLSDASAVVVAVIDTGIRSTHEDLAANMWVNLAELPGNGIDDDGNGYVDDIHGIDAITGSGNSGDDNSHGTHCAGTIGGVGNNSRGVTGVAWKVRLMAVKFLSASGSGSTSDAVECINYARNMGAHILSNSWGGGGYSQALYDAIGAARNSGIIFVAAAGNDSEDAADSTHYPSSFEFDNIVSVAATTRTDSLASFSNYGTGLVDVGAPGETIYSTISSSDTAYGSKSGTSMATPQVAGALALMKARFPADTYRGLINRLNRSVDKTATLSGKVQSQGRINLNAALATTTQAPSNDTFASAATLPATTSYTRSSNRHSTTEAGEPVHAGVATSSNSVWWTWTAPASSTVTVNLAGSDFDTLLAVYTGNSLGSLAEIAGNDDASPGLTPSRLSFTAIAGTTYRIAVASKVAGLTGKVMLRLGVPPPNDHFASASALTGPPTRVTGSNVNASKEPGEPSHAADSGGASVWWSWTAPDSGPVAVHTGGSNFDTLLAVYTGNGFSDPLSLVIQNDNDSAGFVSSRAVFNAVAGTTYRIAVDGKAGASGKISLSIDVPPPNDDFAQRIILSGGPGSVTGSNRGASKEPGEPNHDNDSGGASVWWEWTAAVGGSIEINTVGSNFDTILAIHVGAAVGGLTEIAGDDDSGGARTSKLTFTAVAGTSYKIAVDGWNDGNSPDLGNIRLNITTPPPPPANDAFADAAAISGVSAALSGNNTSATKEPGEPDHGNNSGGGSLWWSWTAPANGTVTIYTDGSSFDTTLGTYTGIGLAALTRVAGDDDSGSGFASRVEFQTVAGTVYHIAVDGYSLARGTVALALDFFAPNFAPVITAASLNPAGNGFADAPVSVGSVTASDPENDAFTLAYQWQFTSTGGLFFDAPGQNAATLSPAAGHGAKRWRCRIIASDSVSSSIPFFTGTVDLASRPVQVARHGQPYGYDAKLFIDSGALAFDRLALINEFSQGDTSGQNREWVEILILQDADLRGWTIRDSQGTAVVTLSSDESSIWRSITAGTLVVIYNSAQRDTVLPADDADPNDANSLLIVGSAVAPHSSGSWPLLGNSGDDIAIRDAGGTLVDGVSYGGRTTYLPALGTVGSRTSARYNGGATGSVDAPASWSTHPAASATPGLANGTTNGTFVEGLRSGLYNETASYRFAATSDVIPGLSIHPETGVVTGMPDVPEGGLFNIVIERHTPTNSTLQSFGLLVGSSSGVYTVPASAAWTLLGNGRIDGTLMASGVIHAGGYNLDIRQSFATWKAAWQVEGAAGDDPDGDGVSLLAEYAFDLSPHGHDPQAVPEFWLESGKLRIKFRRHIGISDLTYAVEASDGLSGWQPLDFETQTIGLPTPGGWDTEECTIEDIGTASGSRFIRVVVTGG